MLRPLPYFSRSWRFRNGFMVQRTLPWPKHLMKWEMWRRCATSWTRLKRDSAGRLIFIEECTATTIIWSRSHFPISQAYTWIRKTPARGTALSRRGPPSLRNVAGRQRKYWHRVHQAGPDPVAREALYGRRARNPGWLRNPDGAEQPVNQFCSRGAQRPCG